MNSPVIININLFKNIYFSPTKYLGETPQVFKSYSAVMEFKNKLEMESCFKSLFVSVKHQKIYFWVCIQPNNYSSRDKIFDYELEITKKYPQKDFSFKIIENSNKDKSRIPDNTIKA